MRAGSRRAPEATLTPHPGVGVHVLFMSPISTRYPSAIRPISHVSLSAAAPGPLPVEAWVCLPKASNAPMANRGGVVGVGAKEGEEDPDPGDGGGDGTADRTRGSRSNGAKRRERKEEAARGSVPYYDGCTSRTNILFAQSRCLCVQSPA